MTDIKPNSTLVIAFTASELKKNVTNAEKVRQEEERKRALQENPLPPHLHPVV